MADPLSVRLAGIQQFERAMKKAEDDLENELRKELRDAGKKVARRAAQLTPKKSGRLAGGWRSHVQGGERPRAVIQNDVPYAEGAEFGKSGKWSGFRQYGPAANRFGFRAVDQMHEEIHRDLKRAAERAADQSGWL